MSALRRHLTATVSMASGGLGVFALVYAMNASEPPPPMPKEQADASFTVEQKKEKKDEKKAKPKPQKQQQSKAAPRAAAPNLAGSLAGGGFDMPGFAIGGMGHMSEKLVGSSSGKNAMMSESSVDQAAKPTRRVAPKYPEKAQKRGIGGRVMVQVYVTDSGSVEKVKVLSADPPGIFDEAAKAAVAQWDFKPCQYEGQAVACMVKVPVEFKLTK